MIKLDKLNTGAHKHLDGKKKLHLAPPEMIEAWTEAAEIGQWKGYGEKDWEKGIPFSVIEASIVRHLHALRKRDPINTEINNKGETRDIHHAFQLLWNVAALATFILRNRDDLDDIKIIPEYKGNFESFTPAVLPETTLMFTKDNDIIWENPTPTVAAGPSYMYGIGDKDE